MKTYTITPGNIAAVCYVDVDGARETFIYLAADKLPATLVRNDAEQFNAFLALPLAVRAAINKHFYAVFALPVERRGEHLGNCVPFTVEA